MSITGADEFGFGTEDVGTTNDSTANGNHSLGLLCSELQLALYLGLKHIAHYTCAHSSYSREPHVQMSLVSAQKMQRQLLTARPTVTARVPDRISFA